MNVFLLWDECDWLNGFDWVFYFGFKICYLFFLLYVFINISKNRLLYIFYKMIVIEMLFSVYDDVLFVVDILGYYIILSVV